MTQDDRIRAFVEAAVPPHYNHREGGVEAAQAMLDAHPELAAADFYTSVMTGEVEAFRKHLAAEASLAMRKGGPADWEPLLYLAFSRFLAHDAVRAANMITIARELLDAGVDPNAMFMNKHEPETVLYGAAGVANNAELTKMLLDAGVDPNEEEAPYHVVEFKDMRCAVLLYDAGLTEHSQATMLLHKLDMDDLPGYKALLDVGMNPNLQGKWGESPLHFAVKRFRALPFFALLIEYGADVNAVTKSGRSVYAIAARFGRDDVMELLVKHGASTDMSEGDRFIGALAANEPQQKETQRGEVRDNDEPEEKQQ